MTPFETVLGYRGTAANHVLLQRWFNIQYARAD